MNNLIKSLFKSKTVLEGENSEHQEKMIQGVLSLQQTTLKECMIPRVDVDFISQDIDEDKLIKNILDSGHSRFPVYLDTIDNITGILYIKDVLQARERKQKIEDIQEISRKPYFVPESMTLGNLLKEFKKRHVHIAIVVDEYGGVSGIISMEDIIEEIVGDIQDEFDNEEEEIVPTGNNTYLCDARLNIQDLNEELNLNLPIDDFDTIGGFVFSLFEKIPVRYEKVGYKNLDFIIQKVEGHRIETIKVVIKPETDNF